jgi:CheY-like chemotaxis protein
MGHPEIMSVSCLVVDDNRDFLRAARNILEGDAITVVGVASTAAQAGQACQELRPEIVLVDIDLGEESGVEVARQIADQLGPDQPRVILISAYSAEDFEEVIADTPAVSFLSKGSLSVSAVLDIFAGAGGAPPFSTS